jgi:hypothetical protein
MSDILTWLETRKAGSTSEEAARAQMAAAGSKE